ncbi:MAG: D-alanine--D-alanine ligase [Chloroflexi bacterium]|nr:D-alanine--D-alanine ligase [Chloroflexota bacterium]
MQRRKIAVLMGGKSAEREISLKTGDQVIRALVSQGHKVVGIDIGDRLLERLQDEAPDVCFIALHGRFGEDGTIQGLLELLGFPYTGSGVLASAVGMDKIISKKIFKADGIPTPSFAYLTIDEYDNNKAWQTERALALVGVPAVVKPAREGSTIGMSIIRGNEELGAALELAFQHDERALVERFVSGTEVTVGVLGNTPAALPTLEIVTETDFYDYDTKYTAGLSRHIIPARVPEEQRVMAQDLAVKAHLALGCKGFSRVDFIIDEEGAPYVLEVNTIPGMTEVSLFPDAAKAAGIPFGELVERLVEFALESAPTSAANLTD